jgi:hypothetical protein
MFTTFYHGITKKITAAFGTMFNNIYIERGSGNTYKKIKVPLTYAPKERMMERLNLELDDPIAYATALGIPRMSFMMTGLEYDTERKRNSRTTRMAEKIQTNGDVIIHHHFAEVPYKLNYSLFVYTRAMDDGLKIVEQILPYFTPEFTITIKPSVLSDAYEKIDIPITLVSTETDQQFEGSFKEENQRTIIFELKFTARTLFYGPVKQSGLIKIIDVNLFNLD